MGEVPVLNLVVEFEEVDGVRKIKRVDGKHPIEEYGHMLIEMDREYQKNHNGWPLIDHSVCKAKGGYGEPEHYEITIYSLETGEMVPIEKTIVIDKATGKPATIRTKEGKYTPKAESVFHVGQMLTHEKIKEASIKRGLQIRSEQLKKLAEISEGLEG